MQGLKVIVVSITTFLSSDRQYLLGDKVKDVPFENYFEELLKPQTIHPTPFD